MNINKNQLMKEFKVKNYGYVFKDAYQIAEFLISEKYKINDKDQSEEMIQDCLESLWDKILKGKVKEDKNLFAFIWTNTNFKILDILKKERRRNKIAKFVSYELLLQEDPGTLFLGTSVGRQKKAKMVRI